MKTVNVIDERGEITYVEVVDGTPSLYFDPAPVTAKLVSFEETLNRPDDNRITQCDIHQANKYVDVYLLADFPSDIKHDSGVAHLCFMSSITRMYFLWLRDDAGLKRRLTVEKDRADHLVSSGQKIIKDAADLKRKLTAEKTAGQGLERQIQHLDATLIDRSAALMNSTNRNDELAAIAAAKHSKLCWVTVGLLMSTAVHLYKLFF
jgi:hypothetical protein